MASIDGRAMISVRGNLDTGKGERMEDITRKHVAGIAYRKIGAQGQKTSISSVVDVGSEATAKSEFEAYEALQGTLVTLVDDAGNSWSNVAIISVVRTGVKRVYTPVGGTSGGGWLLTCQWVIQLTDAT